MKNKMIFGMCFFIIMNACLAEQGNTNYFNGPSYKHQAKCLSNNDTIYDRNKVLDTLLFILNTSVPKYKEIFPSGFYLNRKGYCSGFSIYDLTDTTNYEDAAHGYVRFYNYHVYHFFPSLITFSRSNIAVLVNGEIIIFKSINCDGDSVEDVINYLNEILPDDSQKAIIIGRVKEYRKYGKYLRIDEQSNFECN